jgi:Zn-dependent protease/CBS domain-containing protein
MAGGIPVARILGFEIRVHLGWIVVLGLIGAVSLDRIRSVDPGVSDLAGLLLAGTVAAGFLVSALVHDLAHAVVARRRGVEQGIVTISYFGGAAPDDPSSERADDEIAIALAGPVASLTLAVGSAGLALVVGGLADGAATDAGALLWVLAALNAVVGAVNLVPSYPLDGGRLVRALAWRRTGTPLRGSVQAGSVGRITGYVVVGLGLAVAAVSGDLVDGGMVALCGWFLILASRAIEDRARGEQLIGGLLVGDAMEADPISVGPHLTLDTISDRLMDPEDETTAIAVVEGNEVVGVLGYRTVGRLARKTWPATRVETAMARPPRAPMLRADDSLLIAVTRLTRSGTDGLPVLDDGGHLVGLLTRRSVGRVIAERQGAAAPRPSRLPDR